MMMMSVYSKSPKIKNELTPDWAIREIQYFWNVTTAAMPMPFLLGWKKTEKLTSTIGAVNFENHPKFGLSAGQKEIFCN